MADAAAFATKRRRVSASSSRASCHSSEEDGDEGTDDAAAAAGEQEQPLLPGLPDHLAQLCLSRLPPPLLFSVCRTWRRLLYSPTFPPFLSLYALLSSSSSDDGGDDEPVAFFTFDPVSAKWSPLPPPPPEPPLRCLILRHPSFIARSLPVQSVAAAGHLVVLSATTHHLRPALPRPLAFHPASASWRLAPPLPAPRRWCVAGSAGGAVYVVSGVSAEYSSEVTHSAERWYPTGAVSSPSAWERLAPLGNGRFSREAAEAVASRGKLCAVNVRGGALKEGAVYDLRSGRWEEMPAGMLAGWTGPAASAEEEGTIYVVGEGSGVLTAYVWKEDRWVEVAESERLKGASQMAAGGGRVCAVCGDGSRVVVVDVSGAAAAAATGRARGSRIWTVEPPEGKRVLAVHVLPRMSRSESRS